MGKLGRGYPCIVRFGLTCATYLNWGLDHRLGTAWGSGSRRLREGVKAVQEYQHPSTISRVVSLNPTPPPSCSTLADEGSFFKIFCSLNNYIPLSPRSTPHGCRRGWLLWHGAVMLLYVGHGGIHTVYGVYRDSVNFLRAVADN